MNKFLWELMEMEAPSKFCVGGREQSAFLLFPKYHYLSQNNKHTLYMNMVGLINTFTSEKKALERLRQIVENANFPVRVYKVSKYGRNKGKRVLFAENHEQRIDLTNAKEDAFCKVFEIDEWKEETEVG